MFQRHPLHGGCLCAGRKKSPRAELHVLPHHSNQTCVSRASGSVGIVRRSRSAWETPMQESSFSGRADVHVTITNRIIEAIHAGAGEFVMPWHQSGDIGRPINAATGKRYQGTNVIALWAEASLSAFGSGTWATYRQWEGLGAQVRRGERSANIVFYKSLAGSEETEAPPGHRVFARASRVFNAGQVEGWQAPGIQRPNLAELLPAAEAFVARTGAEIRHGHDHACYRRADDRIEVPDRDCFLGSPTSTPTEAYYAVLLHELTHWTGASHRLDRQFGRRFGDDAYAVEELVAELGAAFLCADLGIANAPRPDHAAYLAGWLNVLGSDPKALFTTGRLASQAATFLERL